MTDLDLLPEQFRHAVRMLEVDTPLFHGTSSDFDEASAPLRSRRDWRREIWVSTHWDEADHYARQGKDEARQRVIEYLPKRPLRLVCDIDGIVDGGAACVWASGNIEAAMDAGLDGYAYPGVSDKDPRYGQLSASHVVLFDGNLLRHVITRPAREMPPERVVPAVPR